MRIELITWKDSYGCSPTWGEFHPENVEVMLCESVGRVLFEDDRYVVLAPHRTIPGNLGNPNFCGDMTIPVETIVSRIHLPEPTTPESE